MIIIASKSGRLGNRLFAFSHFIAFAMEHGSIIMNPSFGEYAEYFQARRDDFFCRYPPKKSLLKGNRTIKRLFYYFIDFLTRLMIRARIRCRFLEIIKLDEDESFDLNDKRFVELVNDKKIIIVRGWLFRDRENFNKYAESIREFFKPIETMQNNIATLIKKARVECDILVGIHIRHGDYRTFLNGKYFFNIEMYVKVMEKVTSLFRGRKVMFLICSDAKQDEKNFKKFRFIFGNNHFIEDMYSLAQCDYIIGPPSTYTMWASFYGKAPLYMIKNPDTNISLEIFRVYSE